MKIFIILVFMVNIHCSDDEKFTICKPHNTLLTIKNGSVYYRNGTTETSLKGYDVRKDIFLKCSDEGYLTTLSYSKGNSMFKNCTHNNDLTLEPDCDKLNDIFTLSNGTTRSTTFSTDETHWTYYVMWAVIIVILSVVVIYFCIWTIRRFCFPGHTPANRNNESPNIQLMETTV